jgi:lysophospholipase L1-like esterase
MKQVYEYHPVVGYRFTPNLRARIPHEGGGYLMQVNESGFRSNRRFLKSASPDLQRVLVFGDSFTAGDAVPNHQRYTDLLEAGLCKTEVYNFGIPATGTDQQYLAWREFAQDIEHDVLVIVVLVENMRRVVARFRPQLDENGVERLYAKPYFTLEEGQLVLQHVPPPVEPVDLKDMSKQDQGAVDRGGRFRRLRRLVTAMGAREAVQRLIRYQPLPEYDRASSAGWRLMSAILSQWIGEHKGPVILMPLPLPQHLDQVCDARPYQKRFAELAAATGCVLHDPLPDLLRYEQHQRRRFRWDSDIHFTPEGHRALANSLSPTLVRVLGQS